MVPSREAISNAVRHGGAGLIRVEASRGEGLRRLTITDDGRAPLDAAGLRLEERLGKVAASLGRVGAKGGCRARLRGSSS